jgi:serine/threonine-protein kinase RsbW
MSDLPAALRVPADLDRLAEIRQFVEKAAAIHTADEQVVWDVVQAVDEWVANIIVHGYRHHPGSIDLVVRAARGSLVISITDRAPVFDPTRAPEPDLSLPLQQRPLGGMGIHLIRQTMDEMRHREVAGGGNELTIVKHLEGAASAETEAREKTA